MNTDLARLLAIGHYDEVQERYGDLLIAKYHFCWVGRWELGFPEHPNGIQALAELRALGATWKLCSEQAARMCKLAQREERRLAKKKNDSWRHWV